MARKLGTIMFATLLILSAMPFELSAQGRGFGGGRGGTAAHNAPVPAQAPVSAPGPAFVSRPAAGFVLPPVVTGAAIPGSIIRGSHFPAGPRQRTIVVPQPFGFYSPYAWGSPIYPSIYTQPLYAEPAYLTSPAAAQAPVVSQNEVDLAYEVQRLSREVEQFRLEQAAQSSTQPRPQPAPEPPGPPTTLVFRDGHRVEIQNYAIVGQTLWVLEERVSTKISLSDLDLEATQIENRGRRVRFPLPDK